MACEKLFLVSGNGKWQQMPFWICLSCSLSLGVKAFLWKSNFWEVPRTRFFWIQKVKIPFSFGTLILRSSKHWNFLHSTRCSPRTRMLTRTLMVQMSKHMDMQSRRTLVCNSLFEQSCTYFPCYQSKVWSAECSVWSVKSSVWSVKCGVWSVK